MYLKIAIRQLITLNKLKIEGIFVYKMEFYNKLYKIGVTMN